MKVRVLGIRSLDYVNKQGRRVVGVQFHCSFLDDAVTGEAVDRFFISQRYLPIDGSLPEIGCFVTLSFDRYGHCIGFS